MLAIANISPKFYGNNDPAYVQNVKDIYDELDLKKMYKTFEEDSYNEIIAQVKTTDQLALNHDVFYSFLNRIYKRNV